VPGCGDSKLGHEMRLDGYGKITSIDFEEEVIEQMKIGRGVEGIEDYIKMDILEMNGIDENSIDVNIDKGTLDALYSGKDANNEAEVDKYFNELQRVTKTNNGQIVFISLLQSHILKKIIKFFLVNEGGSNTYHSNSITEVKIQEI
jgi:ubiquinone/menaquinone biosynthesis C-methylase UbiE